MIVLNLLSPDKSQNLHFRLILLHILKVPEKKSTPIVGSHIENLVEINFLHILVLPTFLSPNINILKI